MSSDFPSADGEIDGNWTPGVVGTWIVPTSLAVFASRSSTMSRSSGALPTIRYRNSAGTSIFFTVTVRSGAGVGLGVGEGDGVAVAVGLAVCAGEGDANAVWELRGKRAARAPYVVRPDTSATPTRTVTHRSRSPIGGHRSSARYPRRRGACAAHPIRCSGAVPAARACRHGSGTRPRGSGDRSLRQRVPAAPPCGAPVLAVQGRGSLRGRRRRALRDPGLLWEARRRRRWGAGLASADDRVRGAGSRERPCAADARPRLRQRPHAADDDSRRDRQRRHEQGARLLARLRQHATERVQIAVRVLLEDPLAALAAERIDPPLVAQTKCFLSKRFIADNALLFVHAGCTSTSG